MAGEKDEQEREERRIESSKTMEQDLSAVRGPC